MKRAFAVLLIFVTAITACKKNTDQQNINTSDPKLKSITHPTDTSQALCVGCPPIYTQTKEYFFYDNADKLTSRIVVSSSTTNSITRMDSVIYTYSYTGPLISGYSETKNNVSIYHLLLYNLQNRLILDSVTNPQSDNNRVSSFRYLPDTAIQTTRITAALGVTTIIDTLAYVGNNIRVERIKNINPNNTFYYRELTYTVSPYKNPYACSNNFELFASEYRNGGALAISFSIFTPQNILYNLATRVDVRYGSTPAMPTQVSNPYSITLNSQGIVQSVANINNQNKVTLFEYY